MELPLLHRITLGVLALALTLAFARWLQAERPAQAQRAGALGGEAWYAATMAEAPIGYLSTNTWRDFLGYWRFESFLHFSVDGNPPVAISETLAFHPLPPYPLVEAEHWRRRPGVQPEGVVAQASGGTLQVSFVRGDQATTHRLHGDFSMGDHLAVESWLVSEQPRRGARFAFKTLDFNQGKLVNRVFKVLDENPIGYRLASAAPLKATEIQLDRHFRPVEFSISGLFEIRRATKADALKPITPRRQADHRIPLDHPLQDPTSIKQLLLSTSSGHNLRHIWPGAERGQDGWHLALAANPISVDDDPTEALHETLAYPVSHGEVARLAQRAVDGAVGEAVQLAALVAFVHGYIDYQPDAAPASVLETLAVRKGNCTEFANLFTTLARALGWPARTVTGLAYAQGGEPALAFHAWNEVAPEGVWQVVDPTWNQVRVDATHVPLLGDQAALLQVLHSAAPLGFRVQEMAYFGDS